MQMGHHIAEESAKSIVFTIFQTLDIICNTIAISIVSLILSGPLESSYNALMDGWQLRELRLKCCEVFSLDSLSCKLNVPAPCVDNVIKSKLSFTKPELSS